MTLSFRKNGMWGPSALTFMALSFLGGCGHGTVSSSTAPLPTPIPTNATTIKHVVIIMQENRSFDNLFNGFPGADTVRSGMSAGQLLTLQPVPFEQGTDVDHSHPGWYKDWNNGAMDGFSHAKSYPIPNLPYAYVPQTETVPYWSLAKAYTLGDRMFQSNTGPSFVAHRYMIAGQSANADENPNGTWGCNASPSTRVAMIGPNGTDLPGSFHASITKQWGICLMRRASRGSTTRLLWGPAGTSGPRSRRSDTFALAPTGPQTLFPECAGPRGHLKRKSSQVTWIVPAGSYSDHANAGLTGEGPDWVASITNAIGASAYWNSTAIFISWDDWGGWYDHVNPPQVDNMGLGFRVPVIVVSPLPAMGTSPIGRTSSAGSCGIPKRCLAPESRYQGHAGR